MLIRLICLSECLRLSFITGNGFSLCRTNKSPPCFAGARYSKINVTQWDYAANPVCFFFSVPQQVAALASVSVWPLRLITVAVQFSLAFISRSNIQYSKRSVMCFRFRRTEVSPVISVRVCVCVAGGLWIVTRGRHDGSVCVCV